MRTASAEAAIILRNVFAVVEIRATGAIMNAPIALNDVRLAFDTSQGPQPLVFVARGAALPPVTATLFYTGSGMLRGRWELGHKYVKAALRTDTRVGGERTVRVDPQGKEAHTEFRLVEQFGARASLLEATLHSGRTHQIRVHAAYCEHPVLGDEKYGDDAANEEFRALGLRRMFLHAHNCSFEWPGGAEQSFSAPLPDDLRAVLEALGVGRSAKGRGRR